MTSITQKLPPELLTEILGHTTVPDVLRLKLVNRIFRDIIRTSPLLQHRIDLFAAGLEYNAASGISIADSRKALLQYRSNLDSLRPIEERVVKSLAPESVRTANGVCATIEDSLRLFVPGSASRGIPYGEWEIPLPAATITNYDLCPNADLLVAVEVTTEAPYPRIGIHLRTLSDGSHHPAARCPTIYYSKTGVGTYIMFSLSVTSSRISTFASAQYKNHFVVWDWKSGEVVFELEEEQYNAMKFIDNYRLLLSLKSTSSSPPSLVLMDTEKNIKGAPLQKLFHLPPYLDRGYLSLLLERGAHEPSPAESMAPFHQDSSQRIVVLELSHAPCYLVLKVESLLEFLEGHEGSEVQWDEWKSYVVVPSVNRDQVELAWVSGCRLFFVCAVESDPDEPDSWEMGVYDFSIQGRAKYMIGQPMMDVGGHRCLSPAGVKAQIPWDVSFDAHCGLDSIIFCRPPDGAAGDVPGVLDIWTF